MTERTSMDDERWEPGMPVLDRQEVSSDAGPAVSSHAGPAVSARSARSAGSAVPGTVAGRGSGRPVPGPLPPSLA
ncbi:MAG: hypothetical protein ACRDGQ_12515, partial [Candidatus Limnocylindrales bacterium]